MTPNYAFEFYHLIIRRMVKKNCPHCHESGFEGRETKRGWVICRCIGRVIARYNAIVKANAMKAAQKRYKLSLIRILSDATNSEKTRAAAESELNKHFPEYLKAVSALSTNIALRRNAKNLKLELAADRAMVG